MPDTKDYKKYGLLLDPKDKDDKLLIEFLEEHKGNKHKNSYSTILRKALELYMEKQK